MSDPTVRRDPQGRVALRIAALLALVVISFWTTGTLSADQDRDPDRQFGNDPNKVVLRWQTFAKANGGDVCLFQGRHGERFGDAFDVAKDNCGGNTTGQQPIILRTVAVADTQQSVLAAFVSFFHDFSSNCEVGHAETVEVVSDILRGTYRFLHTDGDNTSYLIFANPTGAQTKLEDPDNKTKQDSDCSTWSGHHVHQDNGNGIYQPCFPPEPSPDITIDNVWDQRHYWFHRWDFKRGTPDLLNIAQPSDCPAGWPNN